MSYVSLLKNIPDFLSQPTGIAALASLGIHGAIAFILPLMPIDSKPKQQETPKKTVGLVELSQAEQNRLPQASRPQIALQPVPQKPPGLVLPNIASPTQQSSLPPLPPASSTQLVLPPLPPASSTQLVLPPLPKSSTNLAISSLPKGQSLRILPKRDLQQVNPINPALNIGSKTAMVPPQPRYNNDVKLGESTPLPPSNVPELQAANTPVQVEYNSLPTSRAANTSTEVRSSRLPVLQAAKIPVDMQTVGSPMPSNATTTPTAYPNSASPTVGNQRGVPSVAQNQQLIAPIGGTPQGTDKLALANSSLLPPRLQLTPKGSVLPSGSGELGTEKMATFGDQFNQVKRQYPNLETKLPIVGTINAVAGLDSKVEGGLVVDAEGKVELLNFLDSSVSSDRKTQIREYLKTYFQNNPIQATGKPKYYPFSVSFRSNSTSPGIPKQTFPSQSPIVTESTKEGRFSSLTNQNQASSELRQQKLIQRLRLSPKMTQSSSRPQASVPEDLQKPQVNGQPPRRQPVVSTPEVTPQPSPQQSVRKNQLVLPTLTPAKPFAEQGARSNQQAQVPEGPNKRASEQKVTSNQSNTTVDSSQKLLRRLRQLREERQNAHQEQ